MVILGWEITIRRASERVPLERLIDHYERERARVVYALNIADMSFSTGNLDRAHAEISRALGAMTDPLRQPWPVSYGGTD